MSLHAAPTIFPSHGAPDEGVAMVAGVASDAGEAGAGDEVVGADDAEVGGDTAVAAGAAEGAAPALEATHDVDVVEAMRSRSGLQAP